MNQIPKQVLIDYYRQALKINPNNFSLYDKVARLYYEIGELELGVDWYLAQFPQLPLG